MKSATGNKVTFRI